MKKSISIIAFAFFCIMSMSAQNPTPSEFNWISVQTYLRRDGYGFEDITFYDGLGIPAQIVSVNASASDMPENIITPLYYDNMGRESRSYLPYVSGNSGPYIDLSPFIMQYNYYANKYGNDEARYAFTEVMYDNTPLNRIATTYNVGSVFRSGKFTEHCYESNSTDEVKKFEYPPLNGNIMWNCYYNANTLYKISATNADGNKTTEFKNHKGQTILSGNESDSELLDTYYIYDDAGNLCSVLPPALISKINNPSVTGL